MRAVALQHLTWSSKVDDNNLHIFTNHLQFVHEISFSKPSQLSDLFNALTCVFYQTFRLVGSENAGFCK